MDYYVCTRGDRDYRLTESLKYWRFRLVAIPLNQVTVKINKKIMETASTDEPCDIYDVVLDTGTLKIFLEPAMFCHLAVLI